MNQSKSLNKKAFFTAFSITFLGALLAVLNYFSPSIADIFPTLSREIILIFSLLMFLVIGSFLWKSESKSESVKYEFINIVTHKFRTPLTYITWSLENLRKNQTPDEKLESIRQIENAAIRLLEITDILIDISKIDEGYSYVFKAESMREIVERIMKLYADRIREKGIQFNIDMNYDLPLISVDAKRMELVIKILLENAFKYTNKGGFISIKVGLVGKSIKFSITDTGIGISREDMSHMFTKFYRSKEATGADTEGLGMGLFIAKHIIERHGGTLGVTSEGVNKGATFSFEIPMNHGA